MHIYMCTSVYIFNVLLKETHGSEFYHHSYQHPKTTALMALFITYDGMSEMRGGWTPGVRVCE